MTTAPIDLAVAYDATGATFELSFSTVDGDTVRVDRSDDLGGTWEPVWGLEEVPATPGAHVLGDYLAPVAGTCTYRVSVSGDGGVTWSAPSAEVEAEATAGGCWLRRPGSPAMTLFLFVPSEGGDALQVAYIAEKSKRFPRGAKYPIKRSSRQRLDTVTLPSVTTFTRPERDLLQVALNTDATLQLATDDGGLYWVTVDLNYVQALMDSAGRATQAIWNTPVIFDGAGPP